MSLGDVRPAAARGFGRAADVYEAVRPSYPEAAVDLVLGQAGIGGDGRVLDLAAGTGKWTRLLAARGGPGLDLVAVEPVAAMRDRLVASCVEARVVAGTAEAIPLADGSVDLVTVAQAFHWFSAAAALAEIARVLRPGGTVALIWNIRDERVPWVRAFSQLVVERSGGRPYASYHHPGMAPDGSERETMSAGHADELRASGRFGPVSVTDLPNPIDATIDSVVDRVASTSFVAAMERDARLALLDEVRALLDGHPDLVGRERFPFPHDTWIWWASKGGSGT